jgi:hypothetical protein
VSRDRPYRDLPLAEVIKRSSFGDPDVLDHIERTPAEVRRELLARVTGPAPSRLTDRVPATYFYLSHAGTDGRPDPEVRRFFHLLCSYVADWAADVADDEAAATSAARPGVQAGDAVADADDPLACRIFVPLLSDGWYGDERCRAQWERFRSGGDDLRRQQHPFGLPAVVPVHWEPAAGASVPDWAAGMPVVDTAPSPEYAERGMRALLAENDPATYRKVVFRLAGRIHRRAESLAPAPEEP